MSGKQAALRMLILLMALVLLAAAVSGASQALPRKGLYQGTFSILEAWDGFGILSADEPSAKTPRNLPVLQILDAAGKLVETAQWDGNEAKVSADGNEWAITLSAIIGLKKYSFELSSSWTDKTKLQAGLIRLTLKTLGEPSDAAKYVYVLRFSGFGSWVSKDGLAAAVASIEGFNENLSSYLALSPNNSSCTFKSKQISKNDVSKFEKKVFFIEAASAHLKQGEVPGPIIMGINMTKVMAWSYEPVLGLSAAISSGKAEPDVRIFGTVDKQTASPGESLNYTYFLFNAGMDEATDLSVTIPVPEKTGLVISTISGSPGIAKLQPSGKEVEVVKNGQSTSVPDMGIKSIQWSPEGNLRPGETISISFSIKI